MSASVSAANKIIIYPSGFHEDGTVEVSVGLSTGWSCAEALTEGEYDNKKTPNNDNNITGCNPCLENNKIIIG
jgi:hypothetical protein